MALQSKLNNGELTQLLKDCNDANLSVKEKKTHDLILQFAKGNCISARKRPQLFCSQTLGVTDKKEFLKQALPKKKKTDSHVEDGLTQNELIVTKNKVFQLRTPLLNL
jgi:hypothetical protein